MEADLTVSKLDDDKFFVVATDTMHRYIPPCPFHLAPTAPVSLTLTLTPLL